MDFNYKFLFKMYSELFKIERNELKQATIGFNLKYDFNNTNMATDS